MYSTNWNASKKGNFKFIQEFQTCRKLFWSWYVLILVNESMGLLKTYYISLLFLSSFNVNQNGPNAKTSRIKNNDLVSFQVFLGASPKTHLNPVTKHSHGMGLHKPPQVLRRAMSEASWRVTWEAAWRPWAKLTSRDWYSGWFIGILILVYYNPYILGSIIPYIPQTTRVFFHCPGESQGPLL